MDGEEFIVIADRLDRAHVAFAREHEPVLKRIGKAVTPFNKAWSGSNIGYHACVYYEAFSLPPTDARFSQERGLEPSYIEGTRGSWVEYRYADVVEAIYQHAGDPDLSAVQASAGTIRSMVEEARGDLLSSLPSPLESLRTTPTWLNSSTAPRMPSSTRPMSSPAPCCLPGSL